MEDKERIKLLKELSKFIRTTALEVIINAKSGHIGGNLSSVELLTALYFSGIFKFDPSNSKNENRDRVLIRGHEGPLRYTIFSLLGYINYEELQTYRTLGSRLQGHEDMFETPGVDITPSGSLGMLLSYGVGSAIANKEKKLNNKTIVFLGDGEEQEGNVSEAARHAASLNLNNLICILDKNEKQLSRPTNYSDGKSDIKKIWQGYGWDVIEIQDGNNIEEVIKAYEKIKNIVNPTLIVAHTIKGLGVKGALEHFSGYHTLSSAPDKQIVLDSYNKLKECLTASKLSFEKAKEIASKLIVIPENIDMDYKLTVDENVYDIRTFESGINLEEAQDNYFKELKRRIISSNKLSNMFFVTPDLLRKDIVEKVGFQDFTNFIDTGIREQHAIAMCHGLSVENPNSRIYVCYGDAFAFRALDQINAAATGKSNIMIVGENAGVFQGQNGKTHQSVGQPGALMSIPELDFYEPADSVDLYNVFSHILKKNQGVSYIRFHRGTVNITRDKKDLENVVAYFINKVEKPKLVIATSGFMAENAVAVAKKLEKEFNIPTNVINIINQKKFHQHVRELIVNDAPIITLYNGNPQILSQNIANAILGYADIPRPKFIESHGFTNGTSGRVDELIKYYNFDVDGITKLTLKRLKKEI